jgi:hypothetical protein
MILFPLLTDKTVVRQMKRILALAFPTLFMAGALSTPVLAKDVPPQQGAMSGPTLPKSESVPNTGGISPDHDPTGSISRNDAMSALLSAIAGAHGSATALSAMRKVAQLRVVRVRDIARGDDERTVANAVKDNAQDRKALQLAMRTNPVLSTRLKAKKTDPSQIVAARIEADGSVTVFTD